MLSSNFVNPSNRRSLGTAFLPAGASAPRSDISMFLPMAQTPSLQSDVPRPTVRLRSACDSCHKSKIRCTRGNPCNLCRLFNNHCIYSPRNGIGRPKGSKSQRNAASPQSKVRKSRTAETRRNVRGEQHILGLADLKTRVIHPVRSNTLTRDC
jgi:hypothetical protein